MINSETGNGKTASVEVLAERITNLSKKLDEQGVTQKEAVAAALLTSQTAISVALATQEKAVNAAFASTEKAINKAEETQKEYNKTIVNTASDVVRLKESQAQSSGNGLGIREMGGWILSAVMFLLGLAALILKSLH
jgi:Fe-S cluster assembly scaffold protein SufB